MATKKLHENLNDIIRYATISLLAFAVWVIQTFFTSYREGRKEDEDKWNKQQSFNAEFREYQINTNAQLVDIKKGQETVLVKVDNNEANTKKMNENLFKYIPKYMYQWNDYKISAK